MTDRLEWEKRNREELTRKHDELLTPKQRSKLRARWRKFDAQKRSAAERGAAEGARREFNDM